MISEILTKELVWNIVSNNLNIMIPIFLPYIISAVKIGLCLFFIKNIIIWFETLCGESRRKAKKKAEFVCSAIDLFSSVKDLRNSK